MHPDRKILIFIWSLFASAVMIVLGEGIREIEIKSDPPEDEKQIFTVRFVPDETTTYNQMVFDCTLQQELTLLMPEGGMTNKTYEAGTFTSRQRDVKMIKGVDCYVSFFVQLAAKQSCDMAENSKPTTNAPVTVGRVKITAYRGGKVAWKVNTNGSGKYCLEKGVGTNSANAAWKVKEN
jgi:hypothetical protein